jgi:hypothetical protein
MYQGPVMMPRNFLDDQPTIPANSQQADIYQPKATNQPQGQVSTAFFSFTRIEHHLPKMRWYHRAHIPRLLAQNIACRRI